MPKRLFLSLVVFLLLCSVTYTTTIQGQTAVAGVGVIGDSNSEPYAAPCANRGGQYAAVTAVWAELLAAYRNVDFGSGVCQAYNRAISGNTIERHMRAQATELRGYIMSGQVSHVIIYIGYNDFNRQGATVADVPRLLDIYETAVNVLLSAGLNAINILIVDVSGDSPTGETSPAIDAFNAGLNELASNYGTAFISHAASLAEFDSRAQYDGNTLLGYRVGDELLTPTLGNEPHNLQLADTHLGTAGNGLFANAMFTSFLDVPPLRDAEVVAAAGLDDPPLPTPSPSPSPSPTPSPSPIPPPSPTPPPVLKYQLYLPMVVAR